VFTRLGIRLGLGLGLVFWVRDSIRLRCYCTAGRLVVSLGGRLPAAGTLYKTFCLILQQITADQHNLILKPLQITGISRFLFNVAADRMYKLFLGTANGPTVIGSWSTFLSRLASYSQCCRH